MHPEFTWHALANHQHHIPFALQLNSDSPTVRINIISASWYNPGVAHSTSGTKNGTLVIALKVALSCAIANEMILQQTYCNSKASQEENTKFELAV